MPGETRPAELESISDTFQDEVTTDIQTKDGDSWLLNAASRAVGQVIEGRQLGDELDELFSEAQDSGDAERLIRESAGIVSLVGLYHVNRNVLSAQELLEAAPDIVVQSLMNPSEEADEPFASRIADATEAFCLSAEDSSRAQRREDAARMTPQQNELFNTHLDLVTPIARKMVYGHNADEIEEAIADGNLGLVRAVRGFEHSKAKQSEASTKAYVQKFIRGYILHGMRARYGRIYKLKPGSEDAEEQEEMFGTIRYDGIRKVKPSTSYGTAHSLDKPRLLDEDGAETTLHDVLPDPESHDLILDAIYTRELLSELCSDASPRDQEVLCRRFCLDETQATISEAVGVSQMHVSRIIRQHISKLEE